jgi:hypothetical protein
LALAAVDDRTVGLGDGGGDRLAKPTDPVVGARIENGADVVA